jgi:hypothetical protein
MEYVFSCGMEAILKFGGVSQDKQQTTTQVRGYPVSCSFASTRNTYPPVFKQGVLENSPLIN